jgi:branched-chain amino acid transport system ATP-binding protein
MLEARDLAVSYGRVQALFGVSIDVGAGELVAMIGPNGAGKTTTLRTLTGLVTPQTGRVLLDGEDITRMPAERIAARGVAYIPEGGGTFGRLTVEQNLLMGRYPSRRRRAGHAEGIDRVVDIFPALGERRRQRAGSLSGGEQQMLAIARALVSRPRLLLVDEPSHGLAPQVVTALFDSLDALRDEGLGVLVVEQHVTVALARAGRAYILERGRITYAGNAAALAEDTERLANAYLGGR